MTLEQLRPKNLPNSPEVFKGLQNPVMYNYGHYYQPIRYLDFLYKGKTHHVFDTTGRDNKWVTQNYPLGFNQMLSERSIRPIVERGRMQGGKPQRRERKPDSEPLLASGKYSMNIFGIYRDWIKYNSPQLWKQAKQAVEQAQKKEGNSILVGDPYIHLIMPGLSPATQRMLQRIGNEAFKEDFGISPTFTWIPEAAVDYQTLSSLRQEGIQGVVLRRKQVNALRNEDSTAPAYWIATNFGPIIAIVADDNLSGEVSFQFPDAKEFVMKGQVGQPSGFYKGKDYGRITIADGERYGEHWNDIYDPKQPGKGSGAFEFFYWRDKYLTDSQNSGQLTRQIDFTKMPEGKLNFAPGKKSTSWSCDHGTDRWEGKCYEGLDERDSREREHGRLEKQDVWQKMQKAQYMTESILNKLKPNWRDHFVDWFLSQRENLAKNRPISVNSLFLSSIEKKWFVVEATLLLGATSCGTFFGYNSYERQLPRNALESISKLVTNPNNPDFLSDYPIKKRETMRKEWESITPKDFDLLKLQVGLPISNESRENIKRAGLI